MGAELVEPSAGSKAKELEARGVRHHWNGTGPAHRRDQQQTCEQERLNRCQHAGLKPSIEMLRSIGWFGGNWRCQKPPPNKAAGVSSLTSY